MDTHDTDAAIAVNPLPVDLRAAFLAFQTSQAVHAAPVEVVAPVPVAAPVEQPVAEVVPALPKLAELPTVPRVEPAVPAQKPAASHLGEATAGVAPMPARKTRAVVVPAPELDDDDSMDFGDKSQQAESPDYGVRPGAGLTDDNGAKRIVATAVNPALVFEVALNTAPLVDILATYKMTWEEYERMAALPEFATKVYAIREQAERDPNMLVSMKARTLFEAMMPEMFASAMEGGANPAFKYKTFDLFATIARVKPTTAENNGTGGGGTQFVFNLNIDAGYKDVTPVNEIQGYSS